MTRWNKEAQGSWSGIPDSDLKRWAGAAHRTFENIAHEWSLSTHEQSRLLGLSDPGASGILEASFRSPEALERASYILGIYKAINTLLPIRERANAWMRTPSLAPDFNGRSALEVMVGESVEGLRMVRSHLEAQCC